MPDYRIVKARHWPFAPWDVVVPRPRIDLSSTGDVIVTGERTERYAGGFWTRRGAQKWIDEERGQI